MFRSSVLACALLLAAMPSFSSSVTHGTLKRAAEIASLAFAGTVDSTRVEMISGHVVTHVHFSRLRFAKGRHTGDTLTLHMAGGDYEGRRYRTIGQPEFERDRRYIVLIERDLGSFENLYLPVLGLYQGFYPIQADSVTGKTVVHDWRNRPIAAVERGHIVSVATAGSRGSNSRPAVTHDSQSEPAFEILHADDDPGTRMEEIAFLNVIRRFAEGANQK